ncbi:MAG: hypothetical protein GY789_05485 [Hyphomicrobiales bacterium]|nr:hypothetical protein [Hyphomicrobiales bacterium]
MKIVISIAAAAMALTAAAPAVAQGNIVSAGKLKSVISGRCASYAEKTAGTMCFRRGGRIVYQDKTHGDGEGKWYIKGNEFCQVYADSKNDSYCSRLIKTGGNRYKDEAGTNYRFN